MYPHPSESSYRVEALARGLSVLSAFGQPTKTLSLTEIASASGLGKSTAFRLVYTLEETGYLAREPDSKLYRLGIKALELGLAALSNLELRRTARPILEELSQACDETVSLSLLDGLEVVYIDRVRNRSIVGVVLELGSRIPAHCASMGKVMLADLREEELASLLDSSPLLPRTEKSVHEKSTLQEELAMIREEGYALNDEELEVGLRAVAAPVRDHTGRVVAAINITGSIHTISRMRLENELAPMVRASGAAVARALGFTERLS